MEIKKTMELVVKLSIDRASQVLSKTLRTGSKIEIEKIHMVDISQITETRLGSMYDQQGDMIGNLITLEGDIHCKFLFIIKVRNALAFTDLMLRKPQGTTKELNIYTESAIQEIGNILSSSIANTFSKDFDVNIWPSTPTMLHDFRSTIFSTFIIEGAESVEDVIWLIETKFFVVKMQIECEMFLIPSSKNLGDLQKILSKENV